MYELAFNETGHPIELPPDAARWLVRRHRHKKAPKPVFRNAQLTLLPINATLDDLRQVVLEPGRYRLLAVDANNVPLPGVDEAHVEFDLDGSDAPHPSTSEQADRNDARVALAEHPRELLLLETVRANTELAQALAKSNVEMMRAGSMLVRAADGAGLPQRLPLWDADRGDDLADEDDDTDDLAASTASSILSAVLQTALAHGVSLGDVMSLVRPRARTTPRALPGSTSRSASVVTAPTSDVASAPRNASPVDSQAHLVAVLAQLSEDERAYAQRVMARLSPEAIRQWHQLLVSVSVEDAVAMIRAQAGSAPQ